MANHDQQESDLGEDQRRRVQSEEQGLDQGLAEIHDPDQALEVTDEGLDPELAEDLRRAQPNPPLTSAEVEPMSDVDLGYMEDQEREAEWDSDSLEKPVAAEPTDPLEAERERRDRPGEPTELLPDEVGNRPPEHRR
jgi:hypothetical protein